MIAWALWVAVNCSEPRLQFVPFFEKVHHTTFPGQHGEQMHIVNQRTLHTIAAYADYSEAYRDDCGARKR